MLPARRIDALVEQAAGLVAQQVDHPPALFARFVEVGRLVQRQAGREHERADREGLVDEDTLQVGFLRMADQPVTVLRRFPDELLGELPHLFRGIGQFTMAEQVRCPVPAAAVVLVVAEPEGDLPGHELAAEGARLVEQGRVVLLDRDAAEALEGKNAGVVPQVGHRLVAAEGGQGNGDAVHGRLPSRGPTAAKDYAGRPAGPAPGTRITGAKAGPARLPRRRS